MKRAGSRLAVLLFSVAVFWGDGCASAASASSAGLFERPPPGDVAMAWLDRLLRGISLPDALAADAPRLDAVAGALHKALAIYSTGILVLAGFLLFYNLTVMVIETAHYGVPLGRRSVQIWTPIRLVLAIALLVPAGGGLNAGQYLVAWVARSGSALASHAWDVAADGMKDSFSGITMPRGPDVTGFVTTGLEMELCRALYRRAFNESQSDLAVRSAGDIDDIEKLPRTRFAEETWQYSNRLQASVPLCGAFRFAAARPDSDDIAVTGTLDRFSRELADFSRAETGKLTVETRALAESSVPVFLGQAPSAGIHENVTSLIALHQMALDNQLRSLAAGDPGPIDQTLDEFAGAGWITAGGFILELARLQEIYGTLVAHALPAVQPPVFAQGELMHPTLAEAIEADPVLRSFTADQTAPLRTFYTQVGRTEHQARLWLYNSQLADVPMVLANPFDLRDQLDVAGSPDAVSSLFAHILNDAAISYGVWSNRAAGASPLAAAGTGQSLLEIPRAVQNVLTALAEFGRRQVALGNYLFGIAGPDLAPSGTLAYTLLLSAAGLLFMASGFALMFLLPLLPFFRFFLGILAWLFSVFEAIIAVPVVALAHLNFTGESLGGGALRHACVLGLNILIRPVLILFGFITGLLLFTFAVIFLSMIFDHLTQLAAPVNGDLFVTINLALTFLYTLLACAAANVAFKGITLLPNLASGWLGGFAGAERGEAATTTATASSNAQSLPNPAGAPTLLASQTTVAGSARAESQNPLSISAAAKALGLKSALFPRLRDGDKPDLPAPGNIAGLEKRENSSVSGEGIRALPPRTGGESGDSGLQRPDKRRNKNALAAIEKKESRDGKKDNPPAKEPDDS